MWIDSMRHTCPSVLGHQTFHINHVFTCTRISNHKTIIWLCQTIIILWFYQTLYEKTHGISHYETIIIPRKSSSSISNYERIPSGPSFQISISNCENIHSGPSFSISNYETIIILSEPSFSIPVPVLLTIRRFSVGCLSLYQIMRTFSGAIFDIYIY